MKTSIVTLVLSTSVSLFINLASAQTCQQNVTMDDFKIDPQPRQVFDGADRFINLLGGDYGGENITMNFNNINQGYMTVTPTLDKNFFFFKANQKACFDLRNFVALHWDMEAPAGAQSDLTLTVMYENCTTRDDKGDSTYKMITPYTAGNATTGQRQTFFAPLQDFNTNTKGQNYDFQHFKDFTFVNMVPSGATFKFYFFEMVGNCYPIPSTTINGSQVQTTSSSTVKPSSAAVSAKTSASGMTASLFTLLGVIATLY